ncbi:hypothetical protein [Microcoleus sp. Pol12B4]|uniref:hypothetical protein n=1 Tax=Microcoleus sp. Pol12B4 TaxID=3055395 RepID=UPI002FD00CE4
MAAYSAIEYFYSYWLWEIDGRSKLIDGCSQENQLLSDHKKLGKLLDKLQPSSDSRTPALPTGIRFFVNDLSIDWKKYMETEGIPLLIKVRNDLLHGSFISDNTVIFKLNR